MIMEGIATIKSTVVVKLAFSRIFCCELNIAKSLFIPAAITQKIKQYMDILGPP